MKLLIALNLLLATFLCFGQNLSAEEQLKLIEENQALKEQLSQGAGSSIDPVQGAIIMEKLNT
jgi:hypothetical protein